jgi:hypothetical protein
MGEQQLAGGQAAPLPDGRSRSACGGPASSAVRARGPSARFQLLLVSVPAAGVIVPPPPPLLASESPIG